MVRFLQRWDYRDSCGGKTETKELLLNWRSEVLGTICMKLQVLGRQTKDGFRKFSDVGLPLWKTYISTDLISKTSTVNICFL